MFHARGLLDKTRNNPKDISQNPQLPTPEHPVTLLQLSVPVFEPPSRLSPLFYSSHARLLILATRSKRKLDAELRFAVV